MTSLQAVAFGVNALVASCSLDLASLNKGDRLLIRGATGGIGTVTALIAQVNGINVTAAVGVAGSPERDFEMSFLTWVHQS